MAFTMWQVENNLEHFLRSCVVTLRISSNLICRHQKTNISYYSVLIMIGVDGDKRQQQPLKSCQVIPFASSTVAKELLAFWAGFTRLLLLSQWLKLILKKHIDFYFLEFSLNEIWIHLSYFAIILYMHEKINFVEAQWFAFPWIFLINRSISIPFRNTSNLLAKEQKSTKKLFMYLS